MAMRTVRVPGDKSLTHRALILSALADGNSCIRRPLDGGDTRSTAAALRALGCEVPGLDPSGEVTIRGRGLRGLRAPSDALDCGNSGTTARLLMGPLAAHPFASILTGDASLRSRPMRRVTKPLSRMGARFEELGEPDRLPIRIHGGSLDGIDYESPHASAQVKSAILLAGLVGGARVSIAEPRLSRDHTERMLLRAGAVLHRDELDGGAARVTLETTDGLAPLDFDVPGDFSSAAFIIALACHAAAEPVRILDVGLNPTRTGLLDVLGRMGADIELDNVRESCGEPLGDIVVSAAPLRATHIEGDEVPRLIDEIPVLAALAVRAEGATRIEGAAELRVKESDRIAAMAANLREIGVQAEELPDGIVIHGTDRPLAGSVRTHHDHRIAMAFGVLAAADHADITVDDPAAADVSYPGFWTMINGIAAR